MIIQYASDLHLEFSANREWLQEYPLEVKGDVLLLAGDIITFSANQLVGKDFWRWCSDNYKKVLVVPGNHEYYHSEQFTPGEDIQWDIFPNVGYYNNRVVRIEDTDFILSTLWSHLPEKGSELICQSLNDFFEISCGGRNMTMETYNRLHDKSVSFIQNAIMESTAKHIVVVTHHSPSLQTVATEHIISPLRNAFVSDLDYLMEDGRVDYWVYGHSHTNINCKVYNTELVCNQLGYVALGGLQKGFRLDKYFEL